MAIKQLYCQLRVIELVYVEFCFKSLRVVDSTLKGMKKRGEIKLDQVSSSLRMASVTTCSPNRQIITGRHCIACTAGKGSSCSSAII